jgi:retinaldehyde-binding protein 1
MCSLPVGMDTMNLNEELSALAEVQLGETAQTRSQSLHDLKERIQALPVEADRLSDLSDRNLIRFLRNRKYNLDKAVGSCVKYQRYLLKHGKDLENITKEEILRFSQAITVRRDPSSGRLIVLIRAKRIIASYSSEYKAVNPKFLLRLRFFLFERISFDPRAQICGTILIFSCNGLSFWDEMKLPHLSSVSDHIACFDHFLSLGTRFKGAFIYKEPAFLSWVWFFIRPLMSEKVQSRFHFSGSDLTPLYQALKDPNPIADNSSKTPNPNPSSGIGIGIDTTDSLLPISLGGNLSEEDPALSQWIIEECEMLFPE